jgi:HSP20 family protein
MFEEMNRLREELDHVLGGDFGPRWNLPFSRFSFLPGRSARSYPLVNVVERSESFEVEALAPGLDPSTLELSFSDRTLSISGEKTSIADETSNERVHRLERSGGRFHRTVRLEQDVDRDAIQAAYRDGILKVTLPKAESARPRSIEVEVG